MKGLLVKDFRLLKTQRRFFIIVIAIVLIMALPIDDGAFDSTFQIGYMTFLIPLMAVSTISYDEFDNGNAFLFTLPISRREYVYEKYSFCLLLGAMAFGLAVFLSGVFVLLRKVSIMETLVASPLIFGLMVVMLAVMIPIQLKFGAEKGRIATLIVFGIIAVLSIGIVQILKLCGIDIGTLREKLMDLNFGTLLATAAVIAAVLFLLSIRISVVVLRKKEF